MEHIQIAGTIIGLIVGSLTVVPEFNLSVVIMVVIEFIILASAFTGAILALDKFSSRFRIGRKVRSLMTADTDKKIEVMQSEIGTKIDDLHTDIVEMRRDYDMRLDTISDSVGGTAIRISAIEMDHIKQIIVDRRMPLEERISAGDKYITAGGNSDIALMVEVLKEKRKDGLHRYESGDITEAEG